MAAPTRALTVVRVKKNISPTRALVVFYVKDLALTVELEGSFWTSTVDPSAFLSLVEV